MEAVVMGVVVYVAIGLGVWPMFVRYRYRRVAAGHPHTHERDVIRDVVLAMMQGAFCAALWLPIVVSRYTLRAGWRVARLVLGRALRRDYSAARVERLTAELAAYDAPNVVDLRPRREPTRYVIDHEATAALRHAIHEAEQIKALINELDAANRVGAADELRKALRAKLDLMRDIADRLSVAQ